MAANGRIPTAQLAALPKIFSNKRETEHLTKNAYASLVRMMLRATADTGSYFSIWDAYRSMAEQVEMLKRNYTKVSRARSKSSDRSYGGSTWAKKSGRPLTASPGYSNHGNGVAVDIHPAPIQTWLKSNAARFGWVNDVPSEPWHWSYLNPSSDRYRSEGLPDVAAMQRKLGIEADGKPGPGTATAVRTFQKQHGLTVDGIAGPATMKAVLGKGDAGPAPAPTPTPELVKAGEYTLEHRPSPNMNAAREYGGKIEQITTHWWGVWGGQDHSDIVDYLCDANVEKSAHVVISPGLVTELVPDAGVAWANGNRRSNHSSLTAELCPDPARMWETLATYAAWVSTKFDAHGQLPVDGHRDVVSTECPGIFYDHLDAVVDMARGMTVTVTPTGTIPSGGAPRALPTGKALLMALLDAPDFPLLRTKDHRCYYGPRSGPMESVSGHVPNSLNPGEVGTKSATGLKQWQARMRERGYSIAADGLYGDESAAAADNLQRLAGIERDKKIGPDTFYAAWLLPVVS